MKKPAYPINAETWVDNPFTRQLVWGVGFSEVDAILSQIELLSPLERAIFAPSKPPKEYPNRIICSGFPP